MSRRSGQNGYIEKRGKAFYVRYWIDVAGQEKRKLACQRICPVSGPGKMTQSERKRRAKEIIAESGADSVEHFKRVQAANLGLTFRQRAERWLQHVQTRKRKPVKPATALSWKNCLDKWLNPNLGDVPLADVTNLTVKTLVSKLADGGLSAKSIDNYVKIVKMVVASAVDENGEQRFPRKWNHNFIDIPEIRNQRTPTLSAEQVSTILKASSGQYRVLYALLAGTGLRIGEALGLEVGKHVSSDCTTISVGQSVWCGKVQSPKTKNAYREIDLNPSLAALLKDHIGDRTSGFVFQGRNGQPIVSQSSILKRSLHPILTQAGFPKSGFHAFRRYRTTWLRKQRTPEDIIRFWLGHANKTVTDGYSKLSEDVEFRRALAIQVGLGFELPVSEPANDTNWYETELTKAVA